MKNQRWFIVSSTENIKHFFYVNLIVDKQGFPSNSYLTDMQATAPAGYILCCTQAKLAAAIKLAKSEDKYLKICILELDFKNINFAEVYYKDCNNKITNSAANSNVELLLPAPLPLSVIKTIFCKDTKATRELKNEFATDIGIIASVNIKTGSKLFPSSDDLFVNINTDPIFSPASTTPNVPPEVIGTSFRSININPRVLDYTKAFAYSGALALSFYQSKNGVESETMFKALAANNLAKFANLQNLFSWCGASNNPHGEAQLYSLILNEIGNETDHGIIKMQIMNLLRDKDNLPDDLKYIHQFADRLEKINDRTSGKSAEQTFSDMIDAAPKQPKWALKIILILCMVFERDSITTMLKFYHPQFSQQDYMLLAVFYGFMFGITKVPIQIMDIKNLRNWLSAKAAIFMHTSYPSQFNCEPLPQEPALLRSKYLHDGTSNKLHDNFSKFSKKLNFTETDISSWELKTPAEYNVKGSTIKFSKRPTITLLIDNAKLDNSIHQLIGNDELFDFNALYELFEK